MTDRPMFSKGGVVSAVARPKPSTPAPVAPLEAVPDAIEWESWWLPEPVQRWVEAVATAYAVPRVMPIAAAMCAAATLLQGKASVQLKPGWVEPLSLFWLVFSPTAAMKSSVLSLARKPIEQIQDAAARELATDIRLKTNERARLELQIARMRRAVKAHKYTEGAQDHLEQLRELEHELSVCDIPVPPRWLFDDINPAVLLTKMARNLEAEDIARAAVLDAEGTFMANLLGRHSGHVDVSALLKGYTGEPIYKSRASRSSDTEVDTVIPNAYLTMCLLVQPHILDQMRALPELADNGLMGRAIVSQAAGAPGLPPIDAPPVSDAVQSEYARWLATLHAIPTGTVVDLSVHFRKGGVLRKLYAELDADLSKGQGAVGWTKRTLGRVCRLVALSELSNTVELSNGGAGVACTRGEIKTSYLFSLLYSRALTQQQALEPVTHPTLALTHRALEWIRQSNRSTVGSEVSIRELSRGLRLSKDRVLEVCDKLVESGHFEQLAPTVRGNKTLTVTYRVMSLDPLGADAKPALRVVEPLEPEKFLATESAPEAEDYLSDEDFT